MLIKLAALGAAGYAGYMYYQRSSSQRAAKQVGPAIALAGGPLSAQARLQDNADEPPSTEA
jgi:hypothetical protein